MECEGIDDWDPEKDYTYLLCPKCGMCKCHACKCSDSSARGPQFHPRLDDIDDDNDFHDNRDHKFNGL